MEPQNESEERVQLHKPLFEAPGARHGAAQGRPRGGSNLKASESKLPGRTLRAERREADAKAATRETPEQRAARIRALMTTAQLDSLSPTRKRQELVQGAVDFRWKVDKETDEATYVAFVNKSAIAFEDR
jgi:hypothetical protein